MWKFYSCWEFKCSERSVGYKIETWKENDEAEKTEFKFEWQEKEHRFVLYDNFWILKKESPTRLERSRFNELRDNKQLNSTSYVSKWSYNSLMFPNLSRSPLYCRVWFWPRLALRQLDSLNEGPSKQNYNC